MTNPIDESNAGRMRAALDFLSAHPLIESVEEVTESDDEHETEESVDEAAEHDAGEGQHSKGELYHGVADMPGKANAHVRYTPARSSDNPMVEDIDLVKSFREYVAEAEKNEKNDEIGADYCEKCQRENEQRTCTCPEPSDDD